MSSYLSKVGSTYRFRRPVPKDIVAHGLILTARGNPRAEWNVSLHTKDHHAAKRLRLPHIVDTDRQIDEARAKMAIAKSPAFSGEGVGAAPAIENCLPEIRQKAKVRQGKSDDSKLTPVPKVKSPVSPVSITGLYERYALSGTANPNTVAKWRSRIANLVSFIGHDDARRVTRASLNAWTEALIAKGLTKKTVSDGYLPPVKVLMALAFDDELIGANPASRLSVRGPKAVEVRDRDLSDEEARIILNGSLQAQSEKLDIRHALARRWVPWLCAYTGARVAEITQLRAGDIRLEHGVWVIYITPEAGSTKDGKTRRIPLHSHLIEQGILTLACEGDWTPLFYRDGAGSAVYPAFKMRASDLSNWVRALGVTDLNVQPNHGWRHRFKTMARLAGISEELADRIQGHAPKHQGGRYGKRMLPVEVLLTAIERLPRYDVSDPK